MKLATLRVLDDAEIEAIHGATLDILGACGVKILSPRLLEALKAKGLPVDTAAQTVRFPQTVLEDALSRIPPRIEVFDREGQPAFVLGDGVPKIAAGHNAVFWLDSETGETRPSCVADVARFARLCEQSPPIDMIGIPVMPQDVKVAKASLLHAVAATARNSRKPIYFSTDSVRVNRGCIASPRIEELAMPDGGTRQTLRGRMGYRLDRVSGGVVLRYGPLLLAPLNYSDTGVGKGSKVNDELAGYIPEKIKERRPAILPGETDADGFVRYPTHPYPVWNHFEEGPLSRLAYDNLSANVPLRFPDGTVAEQRFLPECYGTTTLDCCSGIPTVFRQD